MKVLILEPDESVRDFLVMVLDSIDIEYKLANSIEECLHTLEKETIELVISENDLEGRTTKPVYEYIKQNKLPIAFALFTALKIQDSDEYHNLLQDGEYNFYIKKPYKDAEFLKVIETVEESIGSITPPGESNKQVEEAADTFKHLSGKISKQKRKEDKNHSIESNSQIQGKLVGANKFNDKQQDKSHSVKTNSEVSGNLTGKNKFRDKQQDKSHSVETDSETSGNLSGKNKFRDKQQDKSHSIETDSEVSGNLTGKNKFRDKQQDKSHSVETDSGASGNLSGKSQSQSKISSLETEQKRIYRGVKINRFYNFEKLPFAIYIKLLNSKMVKIIHENDPYKTSLIKKYQDKSFKELYLDQIYYKQFLQLFSARLSHKMAMAPKSRKNFIASQVILADVLKEEIQEIGISENVYNRTLNIIESTTSFLKKDKDLSNSLRTVLFGVNYISEHSLILNLIVNSLCEEVGWKNQDLDRKLCLASLFHDIGIKNKALSKIMKLDKNLNSEIRQEVQNHPQIAADMLRKIESISNEVIVIISQHHERPDGSGFPHGLSGQSITPMSALFIIAHEYSNYISPDINGPEYSDPQMFLLYLEKNFNQGVFTKPYKAFIDRFGEVIKNERSKQEVS